ncbi:uncharacterized protein F4822DRAFT_259283 [Hypoxylon trugodes]|uniref:uncharacterized protein n=1 Tax=Hypoxylon trugodes TaxID=326681 RepID=UPI00219D7444|nr:uncharacterized protein F4822DRAFT_259283 [Hypoxylon trugodes]KAI1388828.1 hypothetical protein F4822DRAFT_259283 [Hypoxylon trugodes]
MRIPTLTSVLLGALSACSLTSAETTSFSGSTSVVVDGKTYHAKYKGKGLSTDQASDAILASPTDSLTLWIPSSQHLSNPHVLPPTTHATLSSLGVSQTAPLTAAGTFVFQNLTIGSYLVDIHCRTHAFAPLRVDVAQRSTSATNTDGTKEHNETPVFFVWETYRGNDWGNKGQKVQKNGDGYFALRALGPKEYYTERGSFSVFGILKNPMILMGLVSMVLFLGVPKLVENMDPEMRAEWEEQQKNNPMNSIMGGQQSSANPMGNFDMAAYLAGQKKDESEASAAGSNNSGSKKAGKR